VQTARSHAPLLDAARARGFVPTTVAMDMGYDNNRVYAECDERDCAAIIPLRKGQRERNLRILRSPPEWRALYRRRSAVEREFGNLKHNYGLAFLRVRGHRTRPLARRPDHARATRAGGQSRPHYPFGLTATTQRKGGGSSSPGSSTREMLKPALMNALRKFDRGTWLMPTRARIFTL